MENRKAGSQRGNRDQIREGFNLYSESDEKLVKGLSKGVP